MGKATVNWESQETWQRVCAAIIATGVKIDYKQVAMYFATTYDTIENRFRKIKKQATTLKDEIESGERGEIVPARKSASSTPKKAKATPKKDPLSAVTNGRVSKTTTPKSKKTIIKPEMGDDAFSSSLGGMEDAFGHDASYGAPLTPLEDSDFMV